MAAQSPPSPPSPPPLLSDRYGDDETGDTTEQTPFIPEAPETASSHSSRPGLRGRASSLTALLGAVPTAQKPNSVLVILCLIVFVYSASSGFQNMSATRIFEDILCRQYYGQIRGTDEPIDEEMCKVDAIQSKLAYLFAIQASLNAGASVLAALPWGIAADKIGRRPVFAIGLFSMATTTLWLFIVGWFPQTLPPRLIWVSPILYLFGGGNPVVAATITSIAVDVVPESERSASFMRIHGSSMVGNLISPALASIMTASTGPWPPLFLSFLLAALPAFAIFLVPESLKHEQSDNAEEPDSGTFKAHLRHSLHELKKSATVFGSPSMVLVLLITMLQLSLVLSTYQFLSQFVSKRYHIPLADTGYVQSAYGVAFITVSFFIMPFVSSAILKPRAPAFIRFDNDKERDLFLARSSYVASMIGTFILGLSGSLPGFVFGLTVLAFGVSGEGFLKSIATLYVTAEQRTRLFTILGLSAIASDLWVSPALAALFSLGMNLGDTWIGLPYFGISGLCVLMFIMALFLKLPPSPKIDEEAESDERADSE
ncbi:putative major facilitator superfamily transporter [Rosellinia necatrix]|uniref:Putative major facilitator superfamily transporter n=1 Tax=Rosellinia necatrix TaxID=77044 RepID=A0A1W2TK13_ROSNE|nr:putative major facilitator superfamily transporter [Rosellinia necatrix]